MVKIALSLFFAGFFTFGLAQQLSIIPSSANPDVQLVLDKVVAAGGKILVPKMEISPEYGYMGVFIDTEGNRIALHSVPQS